MGAPNRVGALVWAVMTKESAAMAARDDQHCWTWRWVGGREVTECDRCERCERRLSGYVSEQQRPDGGCPGSLYERRQAGPDAYVPDADYMRRAAALGLSRQQVADTYGLDVSRLPVVEE